MVVILQITLQQILQEVADSKQQLKHTIEAAEARILLTLEDYKRKICCLEKENGDLRSQIEGIERKSRKNNIVVFGLDKFQLSTESICEKLNALLNTRIRGEDINDVYYLG